MAIRRFDNTASIEFLGHEINSNTTNTWAAIPIVPIKKCSHVYVIGDKQTLTYTIELRNRNSFGAKLPFKDLIEEGGKYVTGSFKVDGADYAVSVEDSLLRCTLPEIPKHETMKIEFQVDVEFEVFEGQVS